MARREKKGKSKEESSYSSWCWFNRCNRLAPCYIFGFCRVGLGGLKSPNALWLNMQGAWGRGLEESYFWKGPWELSKDSSSLEHNEISNSTYNRNSSAIFLKYSPFFSHIDPFMQFDDRLIGSLRIYLTYNADAGHTAEGGLESKIDWPGLGEGA